MRLFILCCRRDAIQVLISAGRHGRGSFDGCARFTTANSSTGECMVNTFLRAFAAIVLTGLAGCCLAPREPPGGDYKRVSELVRFPDFYPGLGRLYVQPNTLPLGPFRAYDRQGFLVSTIYMVPMKDLDGHKMMEIVEGTPIPVDHVDVHYTSGHPGVPEPHYHVILWHVSPERARNLY
jgi:hypothetical protein